MLGRCYGGCVRLTVLQLLDVLVVVRKVCVLSGLAVRSTPKPIQFGETRLSAVRCCGAVRLWASDLRWKTKAHLGSGPTLIRGRPPCRN